MLQREIMGIIHNQTLRAALMQVSHEFGFAGVPSTYSLQPERTEELVAQGLLVFIVFRSRDGKNHGGTCCFD